MLASREVYRELAQRKKGELARAFPAPIHLFRFALAFGSQLLDVATIHAEQSRSCAATAFAACEGFLAHALRPPSASIKGLACRVKLRAPGSVYGRGIQAAL